MDQPGSLAWMPGVGEDCVLALLVPLRTCVNLYHMWQGSYGVDPSGITPLLSCRLIALDKNPGVHPIGIGETVRRIIARAVL